MTTKVRAQAHAADAIRWSVRLLCGLTGHRWRPTPVWAVTECQFCHADRVEVVRRS